MEKTSSLDDESESLPLEMWLNVFKYVDVATLGVLSQVGHAD